MKMKLIELTHLNYYCFLSCNPWTLIFMSLVSSPVDGTSMEPDKAVDESSAVGSAMGMLSSLSSVVQSTVS